MCCIFWGFFLKFPWSTTITVFCCSAFLGMKLLSVEVRMLSFPAFIMGKGFISREGYLCGPSAMSCESNSEISLWERSPNSGSDVTTPWPRSWLHCRLFAPSRAQGDSGASLIGHGGMCTAEGASLEAALSVAGQRSGSCQADGAEASGKVGSQRKSD